MATNGLEFWVLAQLLVGRNDHSEIVWFCRLTTRISCRAGGNDFNPRETKMPARSTASVRSARRSSKGPILLDNRG
jgi:hypothetical protein